MEKYTVIKEQYLPDIKASGKLLRHNKSGAHLVLIPCDDTNKVFSITFKTPPIDDSGLSHILEHSVLCGSEKYPLKEPFVDLIKGSLNTFLNAFTYADKTMYPVASQNAQDFKNLMSVYMDAVLKPQIYHKEEIFLQEGWRYELQPDGSLTYNGVVYNEMKGALSNPDDILANAISRVLYKDNAYRFVSGGDPKSIPNLSYDEFLNFHKKLYHPSNSYIFLYGNFDEIERLNWLDEAYLSDYEKIDIDTSIAYQLPFLKPVYYEEEYPVVADEESLDGKYYYSYNVCFKNTLDVKTSLAMNTLVNNLFNIPGAEVKEAVIKAGLGSDLYASYRDDYQQPMINIVLTGSSKNKEKEFIDLIDSTLKAIVKNGVNKETFIASLNFDEFKLREARYSIPKGLVYSMTAFTSWLYDKNEPFLYLDTFKYYDDYRKLLNEGYYENLISEAFLNNNHKAYVSLKPSITKAEQDEEVLTNKLRKISDSLTDDDLEKIKERMTKLEAYQQTPDSKEAINSLPQVKLSDIERKVVPLKIEKHSLEGIPYYVSNYETNDILYIRYSFNVNKLNKEESQYLQLLVNLLGSLSTKKYTYAELFNVHKMYTGGISIYIDTVTKEDLTFDNYVTIKYSVLKENLSKANDLIADIILNSNLEDTTRIKEVLNEAKQMFEMEIIDAGTVYASKLAQASLHKLGYFQEITSGVTYYEFLCDQIKALDSDSSSLIKKLQDIYRRIFAKDNLFIHVTTNNDEVLKEGNLIHLLQENNNLTNELEFTKSKKNLAYIIPSNVNFVALASVYQTKDYNGTYRVINNAINNSYLWQEVRVKGGAYGARALMNFTGNLIMSSYRDKNISQTIEAFQNTPVFLASYEVGEEELAKVKIGAFGSLDAPVHVEVLGARALNALLVGYTNEDFQRSRDETFNASLESFKQVSRVLKEALEDSSYAVFGNKHDIELNKNLFDEIRKLR